MDRSCRLAAAGFLFVTWSGCSDTPRGSGSAPSIATFAFDSRRSGVEEVYVANLDGSGVRRITHTTAPGFSCCPRWSPDHTRIAFISDREGDEELYLMDADGSNVQRLTHNSGDDWGPAWLPDGAQIAFLSGPNNHAEILIINVDGTDQHLLGDFVGEASGDLDWSPEGERLLFTSQRYGHPEQSFELNMKTKIVRQLVNSPEGSLSANASWSPSGDYIVFTSDRYGPLDVFRMDLDGSDLRRLTQSPVGSVGSWATAQSPDGAHIVFSSDRLGAATEWRENTEIFVIDEDGMNLRRITFNQWMDAHPDW